MLQLDLGRRPIGILIGRSRIPARLILVLILLAASVIAGLVVGGIARLLFGPLPSWLWYAFIGVEAVVALFLAGALFAADGRR